ncbi:hypothetical protein EWM64_g4403 [Hericium alpestre]|uniref:Uncharacterized protein n=1 Tax=Hericium alpestre TaxID=135208 RepID=A0A4Y9ZXL3_9AGAM|nr:hypothetical protein EWM64_g4403 [Hericium alpestre]
MANTYEHLTQEQVDFFMENGYVVVKNAFFKETADEWTKDVWVRLGMDPNDKSTWSKDRIHMPKHKEERVATFAPKAWEIMKELLGGEDRIDTASSTWGDSFIVNLGAPEYVGATPAEPQNLINWHVDGDFFVHFLDSPEQALLVIPLYTDIKHNGGATYICTDGLDKIANYLSEHPEGVLPTGLSFTPSTSTYEHHPDHPQYWSHLKEVKKCNNFVELTGEVGDVVLMHPLMLHSASKNYIRLPRIITNPPVALRQPFNFNRENPDDYSLVEKKTLKALGVDKFEFKATTERRTVVPKRVFLQRQMLEEEKKRLAELEKSRNNVDISAAQPIAVA